MKKDHHGSCRVEGHLLYMKDNKMSGLCIHDGRLCHTKSNLVMETRVVGRVHEKA